jgi:hypothetical protein
VDGTAGRRVHLARWVTPKGVWPYASWLLPGAFGVYKTTPANRLGLKDNSFYLKPGQDHLIWLVSILVIVLGRSHSSSS